MPELSGPLAQHMAFHVVAMNVVAPLLMLWWPPRRPCAYPALGPASALQLVLLYGWHVPSVTAMAAASWPITLLMDASLFVAALFFWRSVFDAVAERAWSALAALLFAAKLFCLMGVLLTFAPRPLYLDFFRLCLADGSTVSPLADQQSAGLLMLIACPLAYIGAGIAIAARWLGEIERRPAAVGVDMARHD